MKRRGWTTLIVLCAFLLCACEGQPALEPLPDDGVILAFGDSLTYGTGVSADQSYPAVLGTLLSQKVIRSGVPGEISEAGKERLSVVLKKEKPDLVILCHGGNDVLRRLDSRRTEQNLRDMVAMVRDGGAQVVLIAVPRFGLFPDPPEYYKTIKEDLAVPIELEILSDLEADQSMKSDQVHFNQAGYRKMAEAIRDLLAEAGALKT